MSDQLPSDQFAIGEVAIYWRPEAKEHGMEVTIAGPLRLHVSTDRLTGEALRHNSYEVAEPSPSDHYRWFIRPACLRKKKPPAELSTWREVQKACGWQPKQVNA